jgi:nitroimidazol reductase NimA-like FMN-containing flavoprotein (pyridoxamine 5'-phosphate oxidase superfamily)
MFRKMRKKDRQLPQQEGLDILEKCDYGILATVGGDGYPYAVPVNYVYTSGHIYFHCAIEGHKLDNILFNNKVSFCVVDKCEIVPEKFTTKYKSVIAFGKAALVTGEEKREALKKLIYKYSPEYEEEGIKYIVKDFEKVSIVKIDVEIVTGKGN